MLRYDVLTQAELNCIADWAQARKREIELTSGAAAIAAFNGPIKVLPRGEARGARFLQRKTARALPMQSYKGVAC